jgi:L-cysteine:1D-myo-inositol 2-amino-2-deoxy-alpha-D-glucopyranoside ligase
LDNGHEVHYVQNVTDVDDPLLERAERDSADWLVLAMRETALFREDMEALRVVPPRDYVGVTDTIPEITEVIAKLLADGVAYRVDGDNFRDIYYDHSATEQFGYESGYDLETMLRYSAERGGDPDRAGKRHPLDALLWRAERPGEPSWESELGAGRPGWHVECTAIAVNRLGMGFDLQGGGSDLIFPHHEFSAAHAEALSGHHPFARHYTHAAMIGLDGEKMSKSRGNLVFVSRLRGDRVDPMAIRLALLSGHYRVDRDWTDDLLEAGNERLSRWRSAVAQPSAPDASDTVNRLRTYLADDLETPKALRAVDAWAAEALAGQGRDAGAPGLMRSAVDALLGVAL